jgi:hypothetical protein
VLTVTRGLWSFTRFAFSPAETLIFAASERFISQPALTKAIQRLEEAVVFFERAKTLFTTGLEPCCPLSSNCDSTTCKVNTLIVSPASKKEVSLV